VSFLDELLMGRLIRAARCVLTVVWTEERGVLLAGLAYLLIAKDTTDERPAICALLPAIDHDMYGRGASTLLARSVQRTRTRRDFQGGRYSRLRVGQASSVPRLVRVADDVNMTCRRSDVGS